MISTHSYVAQAKELLFNLGVRPISQGVWEFTDVHIASQGYIHHSTVPAALVAYSAVNATFASGRIPGFTLVDMVDKVPCMDGIELTALAMVCGIPAPAFQSSDVRAGIFGQAVWQIVETYALEGCFERNEHFGGNGDHYKLRPRGLDWGGDWKPNPEALKAMRKSYRAMTPLQQVMVLSIMHLYSQGKDDTFLIGGCKTKILAADAMSILRNNGAALSAWGHLVSHYAGW
jgi:hypothetical protein